MYVCLCLCVCAACVCVCVCVYVHVSVHVHVCIHTHTHVCVCLCLCVFPCPCVPMFLSVGVLKFVHLSPEENQVAFSGKMSIHKSSSIMSLPNLHYQWDLHGFCTSTGKLPLLKGAQCQNKKKSSVNSFFLSFPSVHPHPFFFLYRGGCRWLPNPVQCHLKLITRVQVLKIFKENKQTNTKTTTENSLIIIWHQKNRKLY